MCSISIIGTGNMARAIGALAVAGGNAVEVIGRDQRRPLTSPRLSAVPRRESSAPRRGQVER
jgi:predicted dinucleotide-binding enzyme